MIATPRLLALLAVPALALAACDSDPVQPEQGDNAAVPEADPGPEAGIQPKVAVEDAGEPMLMPLGDGPGIDAGTQPCEFEWQDNTIFIASAPGDANSRGKGVIKIDGVDRILTGDRLYGPDGIAAGPTMTDGEFEVSVERAEGEGSLEGDRRSWDAQLVARLNMDASRNYEGGKWVCAA